MMIMETVLFTFAFNLPQHRVFFVSSSYAVSFMACETEIILLRMIKIPKDTYEYY